MLLQRLKKLLFLHLANLPMKSRGWRSRLVKWGGVNIVDPSTTFIGEGVVFDTNYPEDITIEPKVRIAIRCIILTHFLNPQDDTYYRGKIRICKKAYIGCNTVICKPVTIGEGAVVGACSLVTCDIPPYEVWAGSPAKCIRKIERNR